MSADAVFGYAPGKLILMGEHAVVYGQPAIATTIDRGVRVAVSQLTNEMRGPVLRSYAPGFPPLCRPDPDGEGPQKLRAALDALVTIAGERVRGLQFSVDGTIPAGAGLGSSAALAVALLRAVHRFFGDDVDAATVIEQAFAIERVFHGNPSGVDHTVVATGGCLAYRRDQSPTIERIELPRRLRLAVGVANAHAGTANAVGALRDRAKRHPAHYDRCYAAIGALASSGIDHLRRGEYSAFGELMDLNQGYLNALGVSTPLIESLCAIARERGALGAKLSGAGGGGAVIALVDDDPDPIVRAFAAAGCQAFATEVPDATSHPQTGAAT
jgi:hydroxymethylglutaryl-CoA reductase